jgi:nucleoside-diphosphate-sugar epimerase
MSRTVLVTGGSGFIGCYILRVLAARGDRIINFDIRTPAPIGAWLLRAVHSQITFVAGRIEDWSAVVAALKTFRPDVVIHTAGIVDLLTKQPALALHVNLVGTFNILEGCRLFDVERLVNFSSIGVLPKVQYEPMDANHPVILSTEGPASSFYGAAKLAGEAFCWAYNQSYGLDFITLRPASVYGLGMPWSIFIKTMVENSVLGQPTRFKNGRDFARDYTHVEDIAQLAVKAAVVPGEKLHERIFYGSTGQALVTAGQLANIVREQLPSADIQIGPGLSDEDALEIRNRGVLDIEPARTQLGYQPRFADLRDGVAYYIETFRTYLNQPQPTATVNERMTIEES